MAATDRLLSIRDYTTEELLNFFPEGTTVIPIAGPKGESIRRGINRTILQLVRRNLLKQIQAWRRLKARGAVQDHYETTYEITPEEIFKSCAPGNRRPTYFRINGEAVVHASAEVTMKPTLERLGEILAALKPKNVCEIGCGYGRVLFYLADRLPDIEFQGLELTKSGVALADKLKAHPLHETPLGKLLDIKQQGLPAIKKIAFTAGSAYDIPYEDKSFDVVYTFTALEQMSEKLPVALREIHRIAGKYVIFFEPFADANDFYGKLFLWSGNYFRIKTETVKKFGFRPIAAYTAFPVKSTYACSMLVAEVV